MNLLKLLYIMGTTFLQQLQKLAAPQTDLIVEEKSRVSLLFDPKEAATFDRDTFYELGIHGLEELKKFNPKFAEFEKTLFDVTAKKLQRAVQPGEVNKKLDEEILKFMCHLSPYFLLNSAHKTLEWLIQRFQIHRYNVDHLLMLILPYHSTNMFVRVVQLLNIKEPNDRWHWLHPLQNAGVPLAKKTLLNHCASNNWFLSFVCQMPVLHLKICASDSKVLHTLCTFCCTTIVGMMMHTKEISEVQVTHILKLLIKNILSPFVEFSCMCLIIAANLVRSVKLSSEVLSVFVNKLSEYPHLSLYSESCAVLALIYQNQQETIIEVPLKALIKFSKSSLFLPTLQKMRDRGGCVTFLLVALIETSTKNILLHKQTKMLEKFMESLVSSIRVDDYTAEKIILGIVQTYITQRNAESTDLMDMDIEKVDQSIVEWYSNFVKNLEHQYPSAFDAIVTRALETTREETQRKNLLELLGFVPKMNFRLSRTDMIEKLHHPNISMRVEGVEYLMGELNKLKEEDKDFVQDIMKTRLQEDNIEVVQSVLKCPVSSLASLVGEEFFVMQIIKISSKYWYKDNISSTFRKNVVSYLCSDVSFRTKPTAVWMAVLPYLLPENSTAVAVAKIALQSKFCSKHKFMLAVKKGISNLSSPEDPDLFCSVVMNVLTDGQFIPSVSELINLRNEIPIFNTDVVYKFIFSILLTTASCNEDVEVKWEVMDEIMKYYSSPEVTYNIKNGFLLELGTMKKCIKSVRDKKLPIQGVLHFLFTLTSAVHLPKTVSGKHWWHMSFENQNIRKSSMLFFIRIFEVLVGGCMGEKNTKKVTSMYVRSLKNLFENTFPDLHDQLGFLSNLWIVNALSESLREIVNYELQLRALLLGRSLLLEGLPTIGDVTNEGETIVPSLLITLSCPVSPIRIAALELLTVLKDCMGTKELHGYRLLVSRLLDYKKELIIDSEQISVVLYKLLSPDPAVQHSIHALHRRSLATAMNALFDCVCDDNTPWHIRVALLKVLAHVNSKAIMKRLAALGCKILSNAKSNGYQLDCYHSAVLCNILSRFDKSTYSSGENDVWVFFEAALLDSKCLLLNGKKKTCPSVMAMNQITKDFFEAVPDCQENILRILVSIATEADNPDVVSMVGHVIKKIVLNCKYIVLGLEKMRDCKVDVGPSPSGAKKRRSNNQSVPTSFELLKMSPWREGTSLLELIQNKKKLVNVHLLLPSLFDLLKRCLDFEEQAPVEYVKQLILSCILHVCNKLSTERSVPLEDVPGNTIDVELVVQCIRASQNPQTHHHALLVLSQLAGMLPEQVLHNIMAIFTFMGSSILRQDDSYSFQIISKVVDSVIPILVKANDAGVDPVKLFDPVAGVLRVFADALLDIPEHRQIPLFQKLMDTLGCDNFLWLLYVLVIESQVKHRTGPEQYKDGMLPKKLEFIINLSLKFHPSTVIKNSISLMQYFKTLPIEKDQKVCENGHMDNGNLTKLFDVTNSTRSEFHHFKYAIIIFLSGLIGNSDFINQVAVLPTNEVKGMEYLYTELIQSVLQHIQVSVQASDNSAGKPTAKFWKCLLGQSYELLDKVNALLLSDMFLTVILALIENPIHAVSRKAMELMNARLQNEEFFSTCKTEDVLSLVDPLLQIISRISVDSSVEEQLNQQTALASIKLLARLLAAQHTDVFGGILNTLTHLIKVKKVGGNVLASALLCGAELSSSLQAFAVSNLPKFMKILLTVLKKERKTDNPDVVLLAIVTAVYKVVESLAIFLSPYLENLLREITILSSHLLHLQQTQKIIPIVAKLDLIRQKLASEVPLRILVPVVKSTHFYLLGKRKYVAIGLLMSILADSFSEVSSSDYNHLRTELSSFFLAALQFRSDCASTTFDPEIVNSVEGNVVKAMVALVLKLSESSFRPLYYNLFHWATSLDECKERLITFYRVSHCIADCLKGLFVLFAGHFVQNAATVLSEVNLSKSKTLLFGDDKIAEENSLLLLDYVLKTLYSVFLYDSAHFLNKERFDVLMQPLVDQLENTLGGLKAYEERTRNLLSPCLVQFTVVAADDTMWKQINYQILLRTRHSIPVIRLMALETVCGIAQKLGDDFLPQLPETVPFLAELMEDEEEVVEAACVRVVQDMEEMLGEPLKKYF